MYPRLLDLTEIVPGTVAYGRAVEHLVANELRAYLSYRQLSLPLTYFRSLSQIEVDFVVGDRLAIEVKGGGRVSERDAKPLYQLAEDLPSRRKSWSVRSARNAFWMGVRTSCLSRASSKLSGQMN